MFSKVILGFILVVHSFCLGEEKPNYDFPQREVKWKRILSGEHSREIECRCFDYGKFSVYEEKDPYNKGAIEISVRRNGPDRKTDLCQRKHLGKEIPLSFGEGYFDGVVGDNLLVGGADVFGDQVNFQVFRVSDGIKTLEGLRSIQKPLFFRKTGGRISASLYLSLKVNCPLAEIGESCWKEIMKDNQVSPFLGLVAPDCKTSFEAAQSPLTNTALVSTKAVVKDLNKPEIFFLKGQVICNPAP
jgi:hypothetical protein